MSICAFDITSNVVNEKSKKCEQSDNITAMFTYFRR